MISTALPGSIITLSFELLQKNWEKNECSGIKYLLNNISHVKFHLHFYFQNVEFSLSPNGAFYKLTNQRVLCHCILFGL